MECYSTTEKKEIMPFAATWMDLGEVSQIEKEKYCMTFLHLEYKKKKKIQMNFLRKLKETNILTK